MILSLLCGKTNFTWWINANSNLFIHNSFENEFIHNFIFYAALCIVLVLDKLVLALIPKTVCSDNMYDKVMSFIMI